MNRHIINLLFKLLVLQWFILPLSVDSAASSADSLWQRFLSPPDNAKTKVWWFHGETETTRDGITADLEAFRNKGIGGVVYYDQVHGKGENASAVFSPEWWDDLKFATAEAKRLGLTFELNISNGYVAGGPWITAENAMQKIVYTDTLITTDGKHDIIIPKPLHADFRHIATLAFPDKQADDSKAAKPEAVANVKGVDAALLLDENAKLQPISQQGTTITMDFGRKFTASSFTYRSKGRAKAATIAIPTPCVPSDTFVGAGYVKLPPIGELEVSDDGIHYNKICDIPPLYRSMGYKLDRITVAFPSVSGRWFRINLHDWNPSDGSNSPLMMGGIRLSGYPSIDNWETKAAFRPDFPDYENTRACTDDKGISLSSIKNISECVTADGSLRWRAPQGKWQIMTFGHTPTGAKIKHGRKGMSGLECDRMSAKAAQLQWKNFFDTICDTLLHAGLKPNGLIMDSHEAGAQNWTRGFEHEFLRRQGYDIIPWLPVVSGRIVGSRTESDRVLYDFRRTIADLISDNFYATMDSLCRSAGMDFTAQAIGAALTIAGDNIQSKGRVQKPQGEFWAYQTTGGYDIKEASSAARIYGREIASAEAFTDATYRHSFSQLKSLADFAYAMGNNEFVVCASAYQPWLDRIPGSTANGRQYCLNRNNSMWPMSKPFWDYQARCAWMLRQGNAAADICIYIGDDAPVKLLSHKLPALPEGYDWDVCTTDALLNVLTAKGNRIMTKSGTEYRIIIVEKDACVPLTALTKLADMAEHGVPVCADIANIKRIAKLYGWDNSAYRKQLNRLFILDNVHEVTASAMKHDITAALKHHGIHPQLDASTTNSPTDKLYFSQRSMPTSDIFFIYNRSTKTFRDSISIKTCHQYVELWNPVTCHRRTVSALSSGNSQSFILELQPEESVFIISSSIPNSAEPAINYNHTDTIEIDNIWSVKFDTQRNGPSTPVDFKTLADWTTFEDPRIRYYSGEAVYSTDMYIDSSLISRRNNVPVRYILKFNEVNSVARIILNGQEVTTLWCSPWQTDITDFIQTGHNTLQIVCANSLVNRIIGDAALPEKQRTTFCTSEFLKSDDKLERSGIVGNIKIIIMSADN